MTERKIVFIVLTVFAAFFACSSPADSAADHLKQGDAYLQRGNYDAAAAEYTKAGQLDSSIDIATKINQVDDRRVASLLSAGDFDKSVDEAKAALDTSPSDSGREKLADAYIARAWFYKAKRLNTYTLKDLRDAVETAPDYFKSHYELGRFFNNQWQYSLAIPELNKAISLKNDFAPAYSERAFSYYKNLKQDLALADADKSIALDATQAQFYYIRSLVFRAAGKNEEAKSDLQTTLNLSQDGSLTGKAKTDLQALQSAQP